MVRIAKKVIVSRACDNLLLSGGVRSRTPVGWYAFGEHLSEPPSTKFWIRPSSLHCML